MAKSLESETELEDWYRIKGYESLDSPCLVIYYERLVENIQQLKNMVGDDSRIRPHVKTHKMPEVCKLLQKHYINKFKCATIAEAEMLAQIGAADILLAYQPVGPKCNRWIALIKKYPASLFSCLIDNEVSADELNQAASRAGLNLRLFLDIDNGMHRSGTIPEKAEALYLLIQELPGLEVVGLHVYDGHLKIKDPLERQSVSDLQFKVVDQLLEKLNGIRSEDMAMQLVIGGSPSFNTHLHRRNAQVSPGTFVFWDAGYSEAFPDLLFKPAALVLTRVISALDNHTYTLDLGTKAVASEMPFPRVKFLNAPLLSEVFHSEEHLNVAFTKDTKISEPSRQAAHCKAPLKVGDLLYGLPFHICPTVALYDEAVVIKEGKVSAGWHIEARKRKINY